MSGLVEEFTCARCHGRFTKDWTDEEAAEEAKAMWGEDRPNAEHMTTICEDCFLALGQSMTER